MKRSKFLALIFSTVFLAPGRAAPQSAADLFQQGLQKERVAGDLPGAIAIYTRIVRQYPTNRSIAAKALVQLGAAYESLGKSDAKAAYQRVLREYSEQADQVSIARARLDALTSHTNQAARTEPLVRRLWAGEGVDGLGAPTPDGQYLTFVDWETGDLAVRDLTQGTNRRLTNKGPWTKNIAFALYSRPSRDGKQVAYTWFGNESALPELRVIGMDGGESRLLYGAPDLEYIQPYDWSPDGKQIAVALYPKSKKIGQIATVSVGDGSVRVLKTVGWQGADRMSYSPDGKFIVYDAPGARGTGDERDIFIISSDGQFEATLIQHSAQDIALAWTPDGKYVLFGSDRTGTMSIWLAPVANGKPAGEPVLVRRNAELAVIPMGFTANGAFYYSFEPAPFDVYIASLDPKTGRASSSPVRLIDRYVGSNRSATWSRDGKSIAYLSQRRAGLAGKNGRLLVIRSLETGAERVVPTPLSFLGTPRWSPDDKYLLVTGKDPKGVQGIHRVDPQTGAATLLVEGPNSRPYGWSSDGQSFFYVYQNWPKRTFSIIRQSLQTGESKNILTGLNTNIWEAAISADGKQIAYPVLDSGSARIRIVSENGDSVREIHRLSDGYGLACCGTTSWSTDGRYVYISQRKMSGSEKSSIVRIPVDGGSPEEIGITMQQIQGIRPSPDGRHIIFSSGGEKVEVWAMENFLPKKSPARRAKTGTN